MNNTQKILIAIGVGVGVAYLYNRYKKGKTTKATTNSTKMAQGSFELPKEKEPTAMSREEKEEYILDNVSATPKELASGFEGTRFVWNPTIGKMYPVGTIEMGEEPAYADAVFLSAEGDILVEIPQSVEKAENVLKDLNDQELELLFRIVKKQNQNPSILTEEDAVKEMGVTNPKVLQVVKSKLKKIANDIKILKKDATWKERWNARKDMRKKRRKDFRKKMGFDKPVFDIQVAKICGRKPKRGKKAEYKKCVESVADAIRKDIKSTIREEVSESPVATKELLDKNRQRAFQEQITNRRTGAMFGGHRWDGESNAYVENLVDKGLA